MSHLYLLGVATLTLTSASFAGSDTNADLQARLEAAEARISELSAATNANWLNDTRANEIRGLVHDVLADADTRASLQGSNATAGYNGGFTIGNEDGSYSMKINGLVQTRWTYVDNDAVATGSQWGFSNAREWLHFSGTIASDFSFDIRENLGGNIVDPAWANGSFEIADGIGFTMGTMKFAGNREALIGDENQLAMDRDAAYTVRQGIAFDYTGDNLGFTFQFFNNNGGAQGAANMSGYTWNARLEYMVEGTWDQFAAFTSETGGAAGTLVGFSYSGNDAGDGAATNEDQNTWNVDLQMQFGGSNLYVSYGDFSDNVAPATDWNELQVMYGIYLDDSWELYGRYINNNGNAVDGSIFTVGVNNYLAGQNAKWTTEVIWDDSALGANTDVTTVATQIQLYF